MIQLQNCLEDSWHHVLSWKMFSPHHIFIPFVMNSIGAQTDAALFQTKTDDAGLDLTQIFV